MKFVSCSPAHTCHINKISHWNSQGGENLLVLLNGLYILTVFLVFVQTTGEINITALLKLEELREPTALRTLHQEKLALHIAEQQPSLYHQDKYRQHVKIFFPGKGWVSYKRLHVSKSQH